MGAVVRAVGVILGSLLVAAAAFVAGMRAKAPLVQNAVRRVNRSFTNPRQMASAGTPGAWASIIRHTGRTSGRSYETPVVPFPTDDGFVIALPYGDQADWLKNVLAAGKATIVHDGETYTVERPEVVPIEEAAEWFSEKDQKAHEVFNIEHILQVRRSAPVAAE